MGYRVGNLTNRWNTMTNMTDGLLTLDLQSHFTGQELVGVLVKDIQRWAHEQDVAGLTYEEVMPAAHRACALAASITLLSDLPGEPNDDVINLLKVGYPQRVALAMLQAAERERALCMEEYHSRQ